MALPRESMRKKRRKTDCHVAHPEMFFTEGAGFDWSSGIELAHSGWLGRGCRRTAAKRSE